MKKTFVFINECKPGMKIAENIFNEYGAVIVNEGTVLEQYIIDRIENLGIIKTRVYDSDSNDLNLNVSEKFKVQYNQNMNAVKSMLGNISRGGSVDIASVNSITKSISDKINENRDIVSCINDMRNVDEYTYSHSINVSMLCMLIGKWMKYSKDDLDSLIQAGLLHDIGKGKISLDILNKPAALEQEEYEEMKKHSFYGYMVTEGVSDINEDVREGILMHHEREDGSGYPLGARSKDIHEFAKIIAVADIYDAMTANRIYRKKSSPFEVFNMLENNTFGILDTMVVRAFLHNMAAYYIGDIVKLNTGDLGEIVYINPMRISKPIVRIENTYLDLAYEADIKICELV